MTCNRDRVSLFVAGLLAVLAAIPSAKAQPANLIANGSFEDIVDGALSQWRCMGDETVVQKLTVDAGVTTGHSARHECSSFRRMTRDGYAMLVQDGRIGVEQGKWYRFSCWARQEGMSAGMVTVELMTDTAGVTPYTSTVLFHQMPVTAQWQRFERWFEATSAGTENSRLFFYFDFPGTLWVDDVEVVEAPRPEMRYTDVLPSAGRANLLPNASFEFGKDRWAIVGANPYAAFSATAPRAAFEEGGAADGDVCLRFDTTAAPDPYWPNDIYAASLGRVELEKGKAYTLSAAMRASAPGVRAKLRIHFGDPLGGQTGHDQSFELTPEWKRYAFTATASARYGFVIIGPDNGGAPNTVWFDAVQLEQSNAPGAFDTREPLEFGFDTGRYGNLLLAGEPALLKVRATNRAGIVADVTLRLRITDYFDRTVVDCAKPVTVPARSAVALDWPLGLAAKGYYRLHITWEAGGCEQSRTLHLAITEPYPWPDSPFGVNNYPATSQVCGALKNAGITWLRDWTMKWQQIQPAPETLEFKQADAHIARLLSTGMNLLELLPPYPSVSWNSEAPEGASRIAPDYGWGTNFYAPKDRAAMAPFIERVAARYQDRVHVWEYLNEPLYTIHALPNVNQMDATIPTLPGANYTPADYAALLEVFHAAVKKADPGAETIGGLGARPDLLSKEFFEAGGLDHLDAFNLHIYPGKRIPECYISQMDELLANMGDRKPIWMTECSYFGTDDLPWEPYLMSPGPWAPNRLLSDARQCADYMIRYSTIMLAHGVDKIFYHSGHTMGRSLNDNVSIMESWIILDEGEPRKMYPAQSAFANLLGPAPKCTAALDKPAAIGDRGADGVYGYAFQCGERAVLIAWAPGADPYTGPAAWSLRLPPGAEAFDVVGAPLPGQQIALGESPVYITSVSMPAGKLAQACPLVSEPGNKADPGPTSR